MTRYYTLRYNGNLLINRERDLIIGQCGDADLKLPSDSRWEDENFLVIRYRKKSDAWFAVRIASDDVEIKVNGLPLGIACPLSSGDVIEVEDTTIRFSVMDNSAYNPGDGVVMLPSRVRRQAGILLGILSAIVISVICIAVIQNREKDVKDWKIPGKESSVLQMTADSIFVQRLVDGRYVNTDSIGFSDNTPAGTCFITSDSMLVTARHCIQPWLGYNPLNDTLNKRLTELVSRVETAAYMEDDTTTRIVTKLRVGERTYWSYDFSINTYRDLIVNHGTRKVPMMWRSILPSYHRRDVGLGDIAWMENCGMQGSLRLAGERQLAGLRDSEPICILGIPQGKDRIDTNHPGLLSKPSRSESSSRPEDCFYHNDDGSHGYSGGPVLIRRGHRFYVISVYSRKDEYRSINSSWSVPVSEIHSTK